MEVIEAIWFVVWWIFQFGDSLTLAWFGFWLLVMFLTTWRDIVPAVGAAILISGAFWLNPIYLNRNIAEYYWAFAFWFLGSMYLLAAACIVVLTFVVLVVLPLILICERVKKTTLVVAV